MSVHVRRCRLIVGTCLAMSGMCRDVFGEVGLVSGRFLRCRFNVGTCSARSGLCRIEIGEVGLVSGHVRRGWLM